MDQARRVPVQFLEPEIARIILSWEEFASSYSQREQFNDNNQRLGSSYF